ncbi:uncharacterized protein LOC112679305 [Sipha flava]|uniref:Uncharacterized protein LOC112679305 n=1 Tax=Sipha flava TaxID=143950 RepID=A0A2S2Q4G3_9HEMI|nr:uncharacterized protein LOC112679305 [Sipha flava]
MKSRPPQWFRLGRSTLMIVLLCLVVLQIVSDTDQAAMTVDVVRVVRVDVPPVVRSYDAAGPGEPPLLLGCVYALHGGENDDENGDVVATVAPNGTADGRDKRGSPAPELAMDAAMEEVQRQRGLVVKWYFRRNPVPVAEANDAMAIINDNEQVYQWIAGGGPEAGGGLGPLSGRTVDVTEQTPRDDRSALHRVIRVERPAADLTGEYRCQVEDWNAERRSAWQPMVVYTPERIFKVIVDDNDDDDEDDITEGSGGELNSTTSVPTTSSGAPSTGPKMWPTEINITCYAAGMHPEPSMNIWVNGVMQDNVTVVVMEDDGDDDESNDGDSSSTTTTTTTTVRPKVTYRNRFRANRGEEVYRKYAVRANKVVSLRDAEELHGGKQRRRNAVDVECRLRVPGEGTGHGRWKADRFYGAHKSVSYKYRGDQQTATGDAFAAVSSASSVADDDSGRRDGKDDGDVHGDANRGGRSQHASAFVRSAIVFGAATVAAFTLQ